MLQFESSYNKSLEHYTVDEKFTYVMYNIHISKHGNDFSYPDSWYEEITNNPKFYSLAATYSAQIIGLIVCEVKTKTRCNREVGFALHHTNQI